MLSKILRLQSQIEQWMQPRIWNVKISIIRLRILGLQVKVKLLIIRFRLQRVQLRLKKLKNTILKLSRFIESSDGSLNWTSRIVILGSGLTAGILAATYGREYAISFLELGAELSAESIAELSAGPHPEIRPARAVHPILQSAVMLGLFGFFSGLGNWIIKNYDIKKQFENTYKDGNELMFSSSVKALFNQGKEKLPLRIYGFKEMIRLSDRRYIGQSRVNSVTGASSVTRMGHDLEGIMLMNTKLIGFNLNAAHLHKAHFHNIDATRIRLRYAELLDAKLRKVNLTLADLTKADFKECTLDNVDLIGTCLRNADFRRAGFTGGRIAGKRLQGMDLREATLAGVNLIYADLDQAKLEGAKYDNETKFKVGFDPEEHGMVKI